MADLNERARENMGRILLVAVAALMMQLGSQLWSLVAPGGWAAVVLIIYAYGTGLGLVVAALIDVDVDRWGYHIAAWCGFVAVAGVVAVLVLTPGTRFGTDALLFSRYSADLLLSGENPFAQSMAPALDIYSGSIMHVTPQVDGGEIDSLSYPAGMVWVFIPQAASGLGGVNLAETLLVIAVAILAFLVLESPPAIALMPIIAMLGARNLIWASVGGVLDVLWVLPLLVSMRFWHQERFGRAALVFGLAAGTKQTVWPIAAALAIWLWNDADDLAEFRDRASTCLANGSTGFLVLNFPFMIWNPRAWMTSVLTPIESGAAMIHQGVGPTLLTVAGVYGLPDSYYTLLAVASTIVVLGLYALYWDRAKWAAWVVPALILFWYYRSLPSYFTFFLPVGYYAVLLHLDLRRERWVLIGRVHEVAVHSLASIAARVAPENVHPLDSGRAER